MSKRSTVFTALPELKDSDLVYPDYKSGDRIAHTLTLHDTTAFGWCVATLQIKRARRAGQTDRTYAARVIDGQVVRIGLGPHVKQTVSVYVTEKRVPALKRLLDLHNAGADRANAIRDRISSRRAQGAEMRALGRTSWRWDV